MQNLKAFLKREAAQTKALLQDIPAITLVLFVISVIGMNLLANKSINVGVDWLALDAGMLISWLSFLTMDVTVKRFGPKASIKLSFVAAFINLMLALILFAAAKVPGVWGESFVDEGGDIINKALDNTFAGTWYVVLGSTIAFLTSSIVNNISNWAIGKLFVKSNFGTFAARSYLSTAIGQFVDNFLFAIIVSHNFFGWSMLQCVTCSLTGMVFELVCEMIFSPIGYRISKKWERDNIGEKYIKILAESEGKDSGEESLPAESDGTVAENCQNIAENSAESSGQNAPSFEGENGDKSVGEESDESANIAESDGGADIVEAAADSERKDEGEKPTNDNLDQ